jgi:hypothetical protein
MSAPDNWYTGSVGNNYFFLPGSGLSGARSGTFLWGTDSNDGGLDSLFVSDPISVVVGESYTMLADIAYANNGNNPVFSASYSTNGSTWNSVGSNFQPSAPLQWQTGSFTFTATSSVIQFRIGNATQGGVGNDGGISWVRLQGVAGNGDISSYPGVIPEPSSLGLLALGAVGLVARRKR